MDKFLLINGSVKKSGTSRSIIQYMEKQLAGKGKTVSAADLIDIFDQKVLMSDLIEQISKSECIGIITCCYVNTLPYPTIKCLEQLMQDGKKALKGKKLFAIAHGGMPYLDVHEHCVLACKCMGEKMEMDYLGGVIRGLTPLINGKRLEEGNWLTKPIMKGMDLLIDDIIDGRKISPKVQKILNINIPSIVNYPLVALMNFAAKKERKAKGITNFDRKVYLCDKIR